MSKAVKKNTHGGARRGDPARGKSKNHTAKLYDDEVRDLRKYYGSLTKACRHALNQIPGYIPPVKSTKE